MFKSVCLEAKWKKDKSQYLYVTSGQTKVSHENRSVAVKMSHWWSSDPASSSVVCLSLGLSSAWRPQSGQMEKLVGNKSQGYSRNTRWARTFTGRTWIQGEEGEAGTPPQRNRGRILHLHQEAVKDQGFSVEQHRPASKQCFYMKQSLSACSSVCFALPHTPPSLHFFFCFLLLNFLSFLPTFLHTSFFTNSPLPPTSTTKVTFITTWVHGLHFYLLSLFLHLFLSLSPFLAYYYLSVEATLNLFSVKTPLELIESVERQVNWNVSHQKNVHSYEGSGRHFFEVFCLCIGIWMMSFNYRSSETLKVSSQTWFLIWTHPSISISHPLGWKPSKKHRVFPTSSL